MSKKARISEANQEAVERMISAQPILVGIKPAIEIIPDMTERTILHAGPPIEWKDMCNPMKGAIKGALIFEELAKTPEEATQLAESEEIDFSPNHEHQAVGSMSGVTSPSMPVFVVKNKVHGNYAYQAVDIGDFAGGAFDEDTVEYNLRIKNDISPMLEESIKEAGGIDLKTLISKALHMGDELHNRCSAATALFSQILMPHMLRTKIPKKSLLELAEYLTGGPPGEYITIFLAMVSCKLACDAAHKVENSSIVTAMCRNGVDFGIRVSGLGDRWFTAPASIPKGLFFPPYKQEDANPDLGDSAITETRGLGGFVIATAPAITSLVGGTAKDAINYTEEMKEITLSEDPDFTIPALDFRGTRVGIDVRKVVDTGILPIIDTGIAHREAGHPEIGAGLVRPPMEVFNSALKAMVEKFG